MCFCLLLGQLANFMLPTECHSVLSKAWFCELTFDRHLLYLTCQLRSGLPHLQQVACKHRPNPSSQEESYGAHGSTLQLSSAPCACQTPSLRHGLCWCVWVSGCAIFFVDKSIRTISYVNPTKTTKKEELLVPASQGRITGNGGQLFPGLQTNSPNSFSADMREHEMETTN